MSYLLVTHAGFTVDPYARNLLLLSAQLYYSQQNITKKYVENFQTQIQQFCKLHLKCELCNYDIFTHCCQKQSLKLLIFDL